ncbi:MAG TPA: hypothetical protein PLP23_10655 [Panacibacter sp.]|nr:hypothetical protein [Panacibacter sp.]
MKKLLSILLLTAAVSAFAQAPNAEQKKNLYVSIDSLLINYIKYSGFVLPTQNSITDGAIVKFKSLFTPDAIIPDEMNTAFYDGDKKNPEKIVSRSIDALGATMKKDYPDGVNVKLLNSNVSFKDIAGKTIKLLLEKNTVGNTASGLNFENHDTIVLTVKIVSEDYSKLQISGITIVGYSLKFNNDTDHDFVINSKDACPTEAGFFQANGCLTAPEIATIAARKKTMDSLVQVEIKRVADSIAAEKKRVADSIAVVKKRIEDSIARVRAREKEIKDSISLSEFMAKLDRKSKEPAHWVLSLGVNGGAFSSTVTESDLLNHYDSHLSNSTNDPTKFSGKSSVGGDLQLHYFFGPKADFGIGVGIGYQGMKGDIEKNNFSVQYKAQDNAVNGRPSVVYRQIITLLNPIKEDVSINNLSVPVTLMYKTTFSKKIGFQIEGGIVYNLKFGNSIGSTNALFDREAIYKYTSDGTTVYDGNPTTPDQTSWLITKDQASKHSSVLTTEQYFQKMNTNGYNVGLNESASSVTKKFDFDNGSIGLIVRPSVSYIVSNQFSLSLGFYYSSTSFSQNASGYKLIDEHLNYSSLVNGLSKMSVSSYGVRLSITQALFYNPAKWAGQVKQYRDQLKLKKVK